MNDSSETRCVDILRLGDGGYGFVECRRDPEDGHGWRHLHPPVTGFADEASARAAAAAHTRWSAP